MKQKYPQARSTQRRLPWGTFKSNDQKSKSEFWKEQEKGNSLHTNNPSSLLHKAMGRFLSQDLEGQKIVGWYIKSAQRKQTNKQMNCQLRVLYYLVKLTFRNGEIKTFSKKSWSSFHWICLIRSAKGIPSDWIKRMLSSSIKIYGSIKLIGKAKYIVKFRIL